MKSMPFPVLAAVVVATSIASTRAVGQALEWTSGYGRAGTNLEIETGVEFDDGSGPALFVAGPFNAAGDVDAIRVARLRQGRWLDAGGISFLTVAAFAVWDDGTGEALWAAGKFPIPGGGWNAIAKWNGAGWDGFGGPTTHVGSESPPLALTVFDFGQGSRLVAGGIFDTVNGVAGYDSVAAWDGSAWTPASAGLAPHTTFNPIVRAFAVSSVGGSPQLYVSGSGFYAVSPAPTWGPNLAVWNGGLWTQVAMPTVAPSPGSGAPPSVTFDALAAFDDGAGEKLYLGGRFGIVGGVATGALIRYDGSSWSVAPGGVVTTVQALEPSRVVSLRKRTTPLGGELIVGGCFDTVGSMPAIGAAAYSAAGWSNLSTQPGTPGGGIWNAGAAIPFKEFGEDRVLLSTSATVAVPTGPSFTLSPAVVDGGVRRVADETAAPPPAGAYDVANTPDGPRAYVLSRGKILRRQGAAWAQEAVLGGALQTQVANRFLYCDFGNGPEPYVAGALQPVAGFPYSQGLLKMWNGGVWPLGAGAWLTTGSSVRDAEAADLGGGQRIYVVGSGIVLPNTTTVTVAQWNGSVWSAVGAPPPLIVHCAVVHDFGSGPQLFVGGEFSSAGTLVASNVARWNGTSWSPLGTGVGGAVNDMCVFDDGSGPALYAVGEFTTVGVVPAAGAAKWNGSSWSAVGQGLPTTFGVTQQGPRTLAVFDDESGAGPRLYVGGAFGPTGPFVGGLARLEAGVWVPVTGLSGTTPGTPASVFDLTPVRDYDRPGLIVRGDFQRAGARRADGLARLAPYVPTPRLTSSPGSVTFRLEGTTAGLSYVNVFGIEGGSEPVGLGPWAGLYGNDPSSVLLQLALPPGTEPFSVVATGADYEFGPVTLPLGLSLEVVSAFASPTGTPLVSSVDRTIVR